MKRKAFKIAGLTVLVLGMLFICLLVLARYLFPNETVRQQLQALLSEQLQGSVQIDSLAFDPISGFQVGPVEVSKQEKRLVHLDGLTLRYNLLHLLRGKLVVSEVALDGADVTLDLRDFEAQQGEDKGAVPDSPPQPAEAPVQVPQIPLRLDLQSFEIRDSNFTLITGPDLAATLEGVNLQTALSLGSRDAELSGTVRVDRMNATVQGKKVQIPLAVDFALATDLESESLTLTSFDFRADPVVSFSVTGQVEKFLTKKAVTVNLQDVKIDLNRALRLSRNFLPQELRDVQVQGFLSPDIAIEGALYDSGFGGVMRVALQGRDIAVTLPSLGVVVEPTTFTMRSSDIVLTRNAPDSVQAEFAMKAKKVRYQAYEITDLEVDLTGAHALSGQVATKLRLEGQVSAPLPTVGPIVQPLQVEIDTVGNVEDLAVTLNSAAMRVGSLLNITARGGVTRTESHDGTRRVHLVAEVEPRLAQLASLVPPEQASGLVVEKQGKTDLVTLDLQGTLGADFVPQAVIMAADARLGGIRAVVKDPGAQGGLDNLTLAIRGKYEASDQSLRGTVAGRVDFSGLRYGASAAVEKTIVEFGSTVEGELTPELALARLVTDDSVKVGVQGIRYADDAVRADLQRVMLTTRTHEDLLRGDYTLKSLRVSGGPVFEFKANGSYRTEGRQFALEGSLPFLNLGKLATRVSGQALAALSQMNPDGVVSVQVKSSGAVPDLAGLDPYNLPFGVSCGIKLKDVEGLFQGHRVAGANGTVTLTHEHGDVTRVSAITDLRVASINLPPGLPLQHASEVFADLALTAEQFDDLSIRKLRVGMEGADLWLSGSIGGLRGLLEEQGRPMEETLGPVFVKLQSKAGVQVDQFPALLKPYGVDGSGRTEVALSVLKKERGPLDVRVRLDNQKVSVAQEGARVVNLNGPIVVRKVFDWIPSRDGKESNQVFTPTARLPQLRAVALTQQDLNVDEIDLGTLTITKLTGGVTFDRNQLLVQNLAMNILGGGLGGNLVLTSGKAFGLTTRLEAAQLDLNALLEPDRQLSGDSVVDGLVDLTAFFDPDTGKIDLGQTHMDLSITRVGKDALDRLLVFIDPDGSNPSIVGARSAVALANPGTVRVTLRKGMLGLKIRFQDGLLSSFKMDRIPVGRVRHLREVTESIPQWATIRDTMELLGADRYGVDQDGAILIE